MFEIFSNILVCNYFLNLKLILDAYECCREIFNEKVCYFYIVVMLLDTLYCLLVPRNRK